MIVFKEVDKISSLTVVLEISTLAVDEIVEMEEVFFFPTQYGLRQTQTSSLNNGQPVAI